MKKMFILAFAAVLGMAVSCKSPEVTEPDPDPQVQIDEAKVAAFVEMSEYGVYDADVTAVFVLDKKEHEMVWNTKAARFVIQDDYQNALFTAVLTPSAEESYYSVAIASKADGVEAGTYTMKMVKSEDEAAWLWDVQNELGIVILQ